MSDSHSDVPNVKIIPPLVYLAGIVIGIAISIWMPTKIAPEKAFWHQLYPLQRKGRALDITSSRSVCCIPIVRADTLYEQEAAIRIATIRDQMWRSGFNFIAASG